MAFSVSDRSTGQAELAEINITPLVDVMLVLLVIFMVTAPLLSRPIGLSLPQPSDGARPEPPPQRVLSVSMDGGYRLDDRPMTLAELRPRLEDAQVSDPRTVLLVEAADGAEYQAMVAALAEAEASGLRNIAMRR